MPSRLPLHPHLLAATQTPYRHGIGESGWLHTALLPDGRAEVLIKNFVVHTSTFTATIPAGFVSDGASIPWPARLIIDPRGPFRIPGVIHDWLYYCHRFKSRRQADTILVDIALALGASPIATALVWSCLRLFGGRQWRRYRTFDKANKILHPHLDAKDF